MIFSEKKSIGAAGLEGGVYMEKDDIERSVSLLVSEYRFKLILCCKI